MKHIYRCYPLLKLLPLIFGCASIAPGAGSAAVIRYHRQPSLQAVSGPDASAESARSFQWFARAPKGPMTGVALVVHGLNLNPESMSDIIGELNAIGIDSLRVSLQGHGDNFTPLPGMDRTAARLEAFKSVTFASWSEELRQAYRRADQLRRDTNTPLFLVANSYGALLALQMLLTADDFQFDRMVLFAPALSMHDRNSIIRLFNPFPEWVWPSFSPRSYLANRGTPQAAYEVVFETLERFEKACGPKLNVPTLVFIDPKDELISYDGLQSLMREQRLDRWRIHRVVKEAGIASTRIHHLIIDEASVGPSQWGEMMRLMRMHLMAPLAL